MRQTLLVLTALMATVAGQAQVAITVRDGGTREPVPYAHVLWNTLHGGAKGVAVAGPAGECTVPWGTHEAVQGVAIQIDFIGYEPVLDTLRTAVARTYLLKRAQAFNLDELVVTGQYRPTTADKAVQRMHVVNAEQIQRMAAQNLGDVLGQELNMRLAQDNMLGTSLSMRGLGGENVKILVDGVPVIGRQDGNLDLSQIDLTGIDRVEILEGPLSVNYGTNALAGTINLITRKSAGGSSSLKAIAYAEQLGRLNLSVAAGKKFGSNDLLVSLGRNFFGGWTPGQPATYDFATHEADTGRYQKWKPREQYFGRLNYRYEINERWTLSYKGELMQDRIVDRGRPRAPYLESAFDSEFNTQRIDNALFAQGKLAKGQANFLFAHDRYRRTRDMWLRDLTTLEGKPVPGEDDNSRFALTNFRGTWASHADSTRLAYEAGLDLNLETAVGARIADGSEQAIGDYAAFSSAQWNPVQRLVVRPGLRYARNTQYRAPLVPSLDMRLQLDTAFTLRASWAQGFRAPSLKELHLYFVDVNHDIHGNPGLLAESSNNYSLSLNYRKARQRGVLRGEVTGFHDRVRNMISLVDEGNLLYTYTNIGEFRTLGGSLGASWESGHWTIGGGTAITGRRDTLAMQDGQNVYEFSPQVNLQATRHWRKQGWSINLFAKYQGEQQSYIALSDDSLTRGHIAPYLMVDASVSKQVWGQRLAVQAGCKNIANITNIEATISGGGAHSGPGSGSVPLATGRTFFLRLALDLKGKPKEYQP